MESCKWKRTWEFVVQQNEPYSTIDRNKASVSLEKVLDRLRRFGEYNDTLYNLSTVLGYYEILSEELATEGFHNATDFSSFGVDDKRFNAFMEELHSFLLDKNIWDEGKDAKELLGIVVHVLKLADTFRNPGISFVVHRVSPKPRKLKAGWTIEETSDLPSQYQIGIFDNGE